MATFKAACVQNTASNDIERNIEALGQLVRRARDGGADFITTPEVCLMIEQGAKRTRAKAFPEASHPGLAAFKGWARETGAWMLAGSLTILRDDDKLANRSYLIDPKGQVRAQYSKIHMFDVTLPNGETYRESNAYTPGEAAVLAELPWGRLGMTICYDMRFPHLYRDLAKQGADFLTVPSAFTRPTGRAHWEVLLRARAIETGCFVIAAAQCGEHAGGRTTYGHSLIVAPWGEVLCEGGELPGVVTATIDTDRIAEARGRVPSLTHDRPYAAPVPPPAREAAE
jgi:predicted amidohydrolase